MQTHPLDGLTRRPRSAPPPVNPEHSPLTATNRLRLQVVSPEGEIKQEVEAHNIMCTSGLNILGQYLVTGGQASNWVSAGRIGSDTTAAASTQDTLLGNLAMVAMSDTAHMGVSNLGPRTVRYLMTFASNNPAGSQSINEVGLFCNSTSASQMAARAMLGNSSVGKGASDSIQVSYDVVLTTSSVGV